MKLTLPKKASILSPKAKINKAALVKEYAQLAASYEVVWKKLADAKSKCGNCCKNNLEIIQNLQCTCTAAMDDHKETLIALEKANDLIAKLEQALADEQLLIAELESKVCVCKPSFFSKVKAFFISIKNYIVNCFKNKAI